MLPQQHVPLVLGEREITGKPRTGATATLSFELADGAPGDYVARVQVAAVASLPVMQTATGLVFDPAQKLRIV